MPADPTRPRLIRAVAARTPGRLSLLALMLLLRLALGLAAPALLAAALHDLTAGPGRPDQLDRLGGPVAALAWTVAVLAATELIMGMLSATMVASSAVWLQTRVVGHLLRLGDRMPLAPGEATARVAQGTSTASLPYTFIAVCTGLLGSVIALIVLWTIDIYAGLVFSLALPVGVVTARRFMRGMTSAQSTYLSIQSGIADTLVGALAGARTVRASGTVRTEIDRVLAPLPALNSAGSALWRRQRRVVWQLALLVPLVQVLTLAVAGLGITAGRIAPTDLIAVWGYLALASGALSQIDALAEIAHVRAGTARLADMISTPAPAGGAGVLPAGPGAVSWQGVTIDRPGTDSVLDGLDLELRPGVATAFVGPSGAGKSLAAALVGRLIDPDAGRVLLDGVAVTEVPLPDLRRAVTYAFDRPTLIGTTVHDAIRFGRDDLTSADVLAAARAARADTFIRRLPQGYDTPLAQAPLSGGESQRLGLARALVRPARVYVLDDATSGLDTVTEDEVGRAITTLLAGRTRVVVAHRAATAAACDHVVWFDRGRVRAAGRHSDLWLDPGYRDLFADTAGRPALGTMPEVTHG
ncbi:ABC transporter ATP-binding protein [Actinoplanes philippinensis]|uniref:ATP-binding cassette, subfamily B n=1 Tax=Actinoplanes philippinensis TaxID=35752 RepID=A0A1I1ZDT1_9ACTN|nr:ABC transporter ATP-binding protein [Actinoplanes philippinensis]GIE75538.1 ABC transporter ATP-binding protein [Actinoplanes philippinensis]SFE29867.1 ATP-binding cassette, subfamily B [Actinoplanes philippinensis]